MASANMSLEDNASGALNTEKTRLNNNWKKIDAHDHGSGKGVSIATQVAAAVAALATTGAVPDKIMDMIEANYFDIPWCEATGIDLTINATTADVPMATLVDEFPNGQHFASAAALTGTVAKTASSGAVVGTGTLFTSELTVGQVISIPGTAAEEVVVTVITDNTHITVAPVLANSASGQTATRKNTGWVCRQAGRYRIDFRVGVTHVTAGTRKLQYMLNGAAVTGADVQEDIGGTYDKVIRLTWTGNFSLYDHLKPRITSSEASSPFTGPMFSATFLGTPG